MCGMLGRERHAVWLSREGGWVRTYGHWIHGADRAAESTAQLTSTSPWTGAPVAAIAAGDEADVAAAVTSASSAFGAWRTLKPGARGRILTAIADGIRAEREL